MKPVYQTTFAARKPGEKLSEENTGNCLQACIASMLDLPLENVPHFAAMPGDWYSATERWLNENGWGVLVLYPKENYHWWGSAGLYAMAFGKSPRGEHWHGAIYRVNKDDLELAHDPYEGGTGIDGQVKELWFVLPLPNQSSSPEGSA